MKAREPYSTPTSKQAADHWKAQEVSVFRKPYKRDRGVTIVNDPRDLETMLTQEIDHGAQPVFKLRNGEDDLPDPVARTSALIRNHQNMTAEQFLSYCTCAEDLILYHCLYGDMKDANRNQGLKGLADLLFRKQQEVLKQHHIARKEEERKAKEMTATLNIMEKMRAKKLSALKADSEANGD